MASIDTQLNVRTGNRARRARLPVAVAGAMACLVAGDFAHAADRAAAPQSDIWAAAETSLESAPPVAVHPRPSRAQAANDDPDGEVDDRSRPVPATPPADGPAPALAPDAQPQAAASSPPASQPAETARASQRNEQPLPDWLRSIGIGGGAILWYYQPVDTGGVRNVDLFFANLLLDGKFGLVGLHIEPRFRDSRLRAFFPGPVWAQEAYASIKLDPLGTGTVIKAGKAYSHFGLFWDNSFYGNVQVYDGLKLDPDYGLSLEGVVNGGGAAGARYFAQYFIVDGQTNVSLAGRDTISVPNGGGYSRRRNHAILRVEPFVKASDSIGFTAGASGAFLQAALPAPVGTQNVYRAAGDLTVALPHAALWGEYVYQNGQSVTDFPIAATPATGATAATLGRASAHNHYVLAGGQVTYQTLTLRYNVSTGRYTDVSVHEWMHVPALAVAVGDNLTVLAEYVDWKRYAPGGSSLVDRSLDITLNGHF